MNIEDEERHMTFMKYAEMQMQLLDQKKAFLEKQFKILEHEVKQLACSTRYLDQEIHFHDKWIRSLNKKPSLLKRAYKLLSQIWR